MFIKRHFRDGGVSATVKLLSFVLIPVVAMCQDVLTPEEVLAEQSPSDPIEEIIVYGNKTLHHYRLEMYRAQDKVFATFNSLNSDDEFDIHCFKESRTGTRIKRRICRANYVTEAEAAEALAWQLGQPEVPARTVIIHKHKILIEEMDKLVTQRPELLEAVVEYAAAIQDLEGARQEKCDGKIIACKK